MARSAKTAKTTVRRALVVAGMHRSGTSAMARLLSLSGATLPERIMAPAADNPAGFWEPWEMVALNDQILTSLGSSWDDVFALAVADKAESLTSTFLSEAKAFVAANFGDADLMVMKDPRVSVLAPFWREALASGGVDPFYVIMVRNPLAVSRSLNKRNGFSTQKSLLLWASYMLAVERDTRGCDRVFIDYDLMLDDWRGALAKVEAGLGRAMPRSADDAAADIQGFLNRSLRHHEATAKDLSAGGEVWPSARAVFDWFEAAAGGAAPKASLLDGVTAEILALNAAMGEVCADMRRETADLRAAAQAAGDLRTELDAAGAHLAALHAQADAARQEVEAVRGQAEREVTAWREDSAFWRQRAESEQAKAAIFQRSRDGLESERHQWEQAANAHQAFAAAQSAQIVELHQAIATLQASTSWRITAPLRRAILMIRRR